MIRPLLRSQCACGDRWLSPIPLEPGPVKRQAAPQYRGSMDLGFLSLTPEQCLSRLGWTGRQVRKTHEASADLVPF